MQPPSSWRKSSYSTAKGECVEVADLPEAQALRDSKNPGRGAFLFSPGEWEAFIAAAKADEL